MVPAPRGILAPGERANGDWEVGDRVVGDLVAAGLTGDVGEIGFIRSPLMATALGTAPAAGVGGRILSLAVSRYEPLFSGVMTGKAGDFPGPVFAGDCAR